MGELWEVGGWAFLGIPAGFPFRFALSFLVWSCLAFLMLYQRHFLCLAFCHRNVTPAWFFQAETAASFSGLKPPGDGGWLGLHSPLLPPGRRCVWWRGRGADLFVALCLSIGEGGVGGELCDTLGGHVGPRANSA